MFVMKMQINEKKGNHRMLSTNPILTWIQDEESRLGYGNENETTGPQEPGEQGIGWGSLRWRQSKGGKVVLLKIGPPLGTLIK